MLHPNSTDRLHRQWEESGRFIVGRWLHSASISYWAQAPAGDSLYLLQAQQNASLA